MLNKLALYLNNRVKLTGAQYITFAIFAIINYPGSYFFWHNVMIQEYNPLSLRLVAAAISIPLLFYKKWPKILQPYLAMYWYITIMYCLPFFGTLTLLMNNLSNAWLMNMVLGLFLFILLVDWLMFVILLTLGVIIGWLVFVLHGGQIEHLSKASLTLAFYMYVFAVAIGAIFSRSKEKLAKSKIDSAKLLAGTIAHELRTPLGSIIGTAAGLKAYLPKLLDAYKKAKAANVKNLPFIRDPQIEKINQGLSNIEQEVNASNLVINMLLTNLGSSNIDTVDFENLSIYDCVNDTLARYPIPNTLSNLIHIKIKEDFIFNGSKLLTIHLLFNLLKNALYYIRSAKPGDIYISTEITDKYNILYFKDTGEGIEAAQLPNIFEQFYSKTRHGTGVGLAFCKKVMESFNGNISCRSEKGSYTEFILQFPKVNTTKE